MSSLNHNKFVNPVNLRFSCLEDYSQNEEFSKLFLSFYKISAIIMPFSKYLRENEDRKAWNFMIIDSYRAEDTYQLGIQLGQKATKGEIYCLSGDLGVGKTVFTQGFAKGLGIEEAVSSPTFTILQEYETGRLPFIISMCIELQKLMRWMRLAMRTIFMEKEFA